jgi:carboxymethylenebutenolidase
MTPCGFASGMVGLAPQAGWCSPCHSRRDKRAAPPTNATTREKAAEKLTDHFLLLATSPVPRLRYALHSIAIARASGLVMARQPGEIGLHYRGWPDETNNRRSVISPTQGSQIMPDHDLAALWEAHTRTEFETRDVDGTMASMVAQPYVNHIPTMTGGVGHDQLKRFYKYHFIGANPPDTAMKLISRTVGESSLVDEVLFSFTHTSEIDWMLPGIPPTGRRVEIPLVAIVQFNGDKLVHEHIYWDQASVLVQIGVVDPKGLPVAGAETAHKAMDKTLPSNTLMANWSGSEGKPI